MKAFGWAVLVIILVAGLWFGMFALGWIGRATDVVVQQIDPFELRQTGILDAQ